MRRRIASGSELLRLRRHIDNLFALLGAAAEGRDEAWSPAVDLLEDGDRYVVRVDLPDVDASGLELRLVNRELHISGRKGGAGSRIGRRYHRMERAAGVFAVEILLPGPVDPERCAAVLLGGVLEISLPMLYGRPDAVHTITVTEGER